MFAARQCFVKAMRTGYDEAGTEPRPILLKLRGTAYDPTIDYSHVWSGRRKVGECFARCVGGDSVEIEEVQRVGTGFGCVEVWVVGGGYDALGDGLCISLRGDGEDVVGLVTEFEVCEE
jgi:hypothetical protein